MLDLIKKSLLAGLGAAVVTREMVTEATKRLVDEGKLSAEEAERLAEELVDSGRQQWREVEQEAKEAAAKAVESMGLARGDDLDELRVRVANLEQQVRILFEERQKDRAAASEQEEA